jgi:hypothetical protein
LLLEGRDLEELLAQVRDEHGPDARIVSAEKIRSGGIGGLFGHPKYELTVEIPDGTPSSAGGAPTVATLTIDDLAAMADAAELRGQAPGTQAPGTQALGRSESGRSEPDDTAQGAQTAQAAAQIAQAAQLAQRGGPGSAAGPAGSAAGTQLSVAGTQLSAAGTPVSAAGSEMDLPGDVTAESAFAEMLADAAGPPGPWSAAVAAPPPTPSPPSPPGSNAGRTTPARTGGAAENLNRLLANRDKDDGAPSVRPFRPNAGQNVAKLGMKPISSIPADPSPSPRQETSMSVDVSDAIATIERPRTGDSSERLAATYGSPAAGPFTAATPPKERSPERERPPAVKTRPATERAPAADKPQEKSALPRKLQSLGVPADIAFRATAADTYTAIVEAFQALPAAEPAPDGPGETLVVIGESTHAVEVARHVAQELRIEAEDILFAGRNSLAAGISGRRRIAGAHDARIWAKRLRKADASSIVAIEAALDESAWAASIVEAIRPAAVWVVVDASRKTSDVAHQLQGLRRVDAIALRSTLSSGDPASPLSLRLPVALLDGRAPTPYAWAAMLCERLSIVGA